MATAPQSQHWCPKVAELTGYSKGLTWAAVANTKALGVNMLTDDLTCCRSRKRPKACALPILKVACMAFSSAASQLKPTTVMLGDLSQQTHSRSGK